MSYMRQPLYIFHSVGDYLDCMSCGWKHGTTTETERELAVLVIRHVISHTKLLGAEKKKAYDAMWSSKMTKWYPADHGGMQGKFEGPYYWAWKLLPFGLFYKLDAKRHKTWTNAWDLSVGMQNAAIALAGRMYAQGVITKKQFQELSSEAYSAEWGHE